MIVSATMIGFGILVFLIILGPIFGPILFIGCVSGFLTILLTLKLVFGYFPTFLFQNKGYFGVLNPYNILQPFFTASHISFLLSSLLIPMGCTEFMLTGIDVTISQNNDLVKTNPIREAYSTPISFMDNLWLFIYNAVFVFLIKWFVWIVTFGSFRSIVDPALASFILGCQLVSVYTCRIQKRSYASGHLWWCFQNSMRLIGFALPLHLLSKTHKYVALVSFLWLGLTYSAASQLVEPLVREDINKMIGQQQPQQRDRKKQFWGKPQER